MMEMCCYIFIMAKLLIPWRRYIFWSFIHLLWLMMMYILIYIFCNIANLIWAIPICLILVPKFIQIFISLMIYHPVSLKPIPYVHSLVLGWSIIALRLAAIHWPYTKIGSHWSTLSPMRQCMLSRYPEIFPTTS